MFVILEQRLSAKNQYFGLLRAEELNVNVMVPDLKIFLEVQDLILLELSFYAEDITFHCKNVLVACSAEIAFVTVTDTLQAASKLTREWALAIQFLLQKLLD
jgi:hypothetical protein